MSNDDTERKDSPHFKDCTTCSNDWISRLDFLKDPEARIIGYQPSFKNFAKGYVFFNCKCHTTLGLRIKDFDDLYDGPRYTEVLTGTDKCEGHCLDKEDLDDCDSKCAGAYVRKIMQIIKSWPHEE